MTAKNLPAQLEKYRALAKGSIEFPGRSYFVQASADLEASIALNRELLRIIRKAQTEEIGALVTEAETLAAQRGFTTE